MTARTPAIVRGAGFIVLAQGAAAVVMAVILVVRGIAGADQRVVNGLGTAVWFVLIGAGVLAGGWALVAGRRWGRGLAVFTQLLLLPVAWYMAVDSHRPQLGIPVGLVAGITLALLFSRPAVGWAAGDGAAGQAGGGRR
ncbi:hypothetical protein [Mycobacterium sp.]|uniref:hypothetical protein n=1 Tax=Mycobacterium sp. TaxID=1785 RepID=UPI003A860432